MTEFTNNISSVYTDSISRKGTIDLERTPFMRVEEERCWSKLDELRTEATLKLKGTSNDEPIAQYIAHVHAKLEEQRQDALQWLETFKSDKGGAHLEVVHAKRRLVAMYHQEIELLKQDLGAPNFIRARGELIFQGARYVQDPPPLQNILVDNADSVNRNVCRRLYGF